jgi:3-dehydroquinate dehydratase/shikimate dehydrogenase
LSFLCVPIFVESVDQAKRDVAAAVEAGADLIELRLDLMPSPDDVRRVTHGISIPFIFTCRPPYEGGQSDAPDPDRLELLFEVFAERHYLDIELSTLRISPDAARASRKGLIVSFHDFTGRPDKLYNLIGALNASLSDINKIAWMARSIRDNVEAFEILQSRQKPTIALCMGEAGLISRVLAKKFGAFLTYAALRQSEVTAPGQPTVEQLKRLYRWDAIRGDTRVYGVVGAPVAHSLSPAVHNAAFDATGENAVYLPMLVQPGYESFKAFMEEFLAFKPLELRGLSVTIPHKENALRYLIERGAIVEALAREIGAVNTIRVDESGDVQGFNTDHDAIVETVCGGLGMSPHELADKRMAVIGAGGTARTAVAAMARLGATVVVYNRTKERADQLASEFDGKRGKVVSARMEKLCDSCCHVFINATPVGMHPHVDESPLGERLPEFKPDTLVFDTIYNPAKTKLLRQAEQAGARTVGGAEMFIRQAGKQFEIWTGKAAPTDALRAAFDRGMGISPMRNREATA